MSKRAPRFRRQSDARGRHLPGPGPVEADLEALACEGTNLGRVFLRASHLHVQFRLVSWGYASELRGLISNG